MDNSAVRDVVLGSRSLVWQRLRHQTGIQGRVSCAIGHAELASFRFTNADRVWVLSFSRLVAENSAMLLRLRQAGVREVVYVSTSAAVVNRQTHCYEYPRVKQQAEREALALPQGKVLTIGLMYDRTDELPSGANIATSFEELAIFMRSPQWPDGQGRCKRLFRVVERPFSSRLEAVLHAGYGHLLRAVPSYPCLLRPLDLVLRALGMRWYGYTYLSNKLWISTIS